MTMLGPKHSISPKVTVVYKISNFCLGFQAIAADYLQDSHGAQDYSIERQEPK